MDVFDYEDIQLIPNKCVVNSRSECDTSVEFGGRKFKIPVVPANMQTVINADLAESLAKNGYFYVMHRFQPEKRLDFVKRMHDDGVFASISIGVKPNEYDFIKELVQANQIPEYITIDIAHGYSGSVINMIKFVKERMPNTFLIAGNVDPRSRSGA